VLNDPYDELLRRLKAKLKDVDADALDKLKKSKPDLTTEQAMDEIVKRIKKEYGVDLGNPVVRKRLSRQLKRLLR